MSIYKALKSLFGQGHRDNVVFELDAGQSMTLHFRAEGINSATDKYYKLRNTAKKVEIIVNAVASITHIDGVELQAPKTLGTVAANVWTWGIEWDNIIVTADIDSTFFEVYAS